MKKLALLGSTGSIGTQALEIVRAYPHQFKIAAMAAGNQLDLFLNQIEEFQPEMISVSNEENFKKLKSTLKNFHGEIFFGNTGLEQVATCANADWVIAAIPGTLSLLPVLKAIENGKHIALANKELLVCAGQIIYQAAQKNKVQLLPLDSEHSALFQAMHPSLIDGQIHYPLHEIHKMILTASGGPFRSLNRNEIAGKKASEALKHPNWEMGKKVSIDSATLMNKGLEIIEAHHLFQIPFSKIEVLIHPQSIVHSMVEWIDGSILAQLGTADMRIPIQVALSFPDRLSNSFPKLNLLQIQKLEFENPDFEKFPNLKLALQAGIKGGSMPAVMNAANETAVSKYLANEISFYEISEWIEGKMKAHSWIDNPNLEQILAADRFGRS